MRVVKDEVNRWIGPEILGLKLFVSPSPWISLFHPRPAMAFFSFHFLPFVTCVT